MLYNKIKTEDEFQANGINNRRCSFRWELDENSTIREFRIVKNEGGRQVARSRKFYNLDMILAIGYQVRSNVGMQFRNWTSKMIL